MNQTKTSKPPRFKTYSNEVYDLGDSSIFDSYLMYVPTHILCHVPTHNLIIDFF